MVWAARLRGTRGFQKVVAIKTLLPSMATDAEFERMFLDEAGLASRIRHPNVVEVLDLGEQNGVLYQVMEWIDGETLRAVMKASARKGALIPAGIAVRIIMQACAGLHAAHNLKDEKGELLGLVHRDVSPQNIMVTRGGVAKVADFGIAKLARQGVQTEASIVKGKVAYMAPEQIIGEELDRRTDVLALGTVLYELTTGRHPFRSENDAATAQKICADERTPPEKIVPGYSPLLSKVVMKAIAFRPADRYASANDMLRALDQAMPPGSRVSSDEEVATWFASLDIEDRAPMIADAARTSDEVEASDVDFSETAMLSEMSVFQGDRHGSNPSISTSIGALISLPTAVPPSTEEAPKKRRLPAALLGAFLALAVIGIIAIVLVMRATPSSAASPASSSPVPSAVAAIPPVIPASASAAAPVATPAVEARPTPSHSAATPASSASIAAASPRHPTSPPPTKSPGTKPPGGGRTTSGGFASPVTNPGF